MTAVTDPILRTPEPQKRGKIDPTRRGRGNQRQGRSLKKWTFSAGAFTSCQFGLGHINAPTYLVVWSVPGRPRSRSRLLARAAPAQRDCRRDWRDGRPGRTPTGRFLRRRVASRTMDRWLLWRLQTNNHHLDDAGLVDCFLDGKCTMPVPPR
jgi:hypothetical protein